MFYHAQTNTYYQDNPIVGFSVDGNQYPPNWFQISTPEQKEAHGFVEVIESGIRADEKTNWVSEQLTGNIRYIINIPKSQEILDALVATEIDDKLSKVRKVREEILNRLAGIATTALIAGDTDMIQAYVGAKQSLLDITEDLPTTVQGVTDTIVQRYTALVIQAITTAPTIENAFNSVDL